MFVTQLTKHDWYRIYKYLWKAQISPNRFRIFAKFGMVLLVLLAIYLLAPTILRVLLLLLFHIPFTVSISYSGAFFYRNHSFSANILPSSTFFGKN